MKRLQQPPLNGQQSFLTCVAGIEETALRDRLLACIASIDQAIAGYITQGNVQALHSLTPLRSRRNEDPIVVGSVLKSELVKLYDYYMVQKHPARNIYDGILVAANDKCPFCGGIGRPKTLDHYLPKANYPQFSVLPLNLVPCCRDCNTGKSNVVATSANEQVIHPYLDENCFFSEQWIAARVVQTAPCTMDFYVNPPATWSQVRKDRVSKHFQEFDLAKRYSVQSAEELSTLIDQRKQFMADFSPTMFQNFLNSVATSSTFFVNHWRKVMYQALASDVWFCNNNF